LENTPNLKLPYILPSQAQKHVTHNEALQVLDAVVQLSVLDRNLTAPPANPAEGARYIVSPVATGGWAGQDGKIACFLDGAWDFHAPAEGWLAWVADEDTLLAWNGSAWIAASSNVEQLSNGTVKKLGVNTAADTTNRVAVKTESVLLSHDDVTGTGHMRVTLNKAAAAKDAGFVFQTNWSTRALFGTLGDNSFSVKVSPDGSNFSTGLHMRPEDGHIGLAGYTADANNDLGVKGTNVLFDRRANHMRVNLNKAASAHDAGFGFQTGYSPRALFGLLGDDNFTVKVSPDGSKWYDSFRVDAATGKVDLPATNMLTDFAVNLYQDSGRFAGAGATDVTVGAFSFPSYLTLYNGSTVRGAGKFITDSTDYGGTAGALLPAIKDLIDKIRDTSYRRYGLEFWVAEVTMGGTGNSGRFTYGDASYAYSCFTKQQVRAPAHTFHVYLRALDTSLLIFLNAGAALFKNGVKATDHVLIAPSDGWVSITILDNQNPRASRGYMPMLCSIYAQSAGNRWLMACPALMGGLTKVSDDVGVIAASNSWPV
jgi:hypothetical protein